jgi:hypothetical protein
LFGLETAFSGVFDLVELVICHRVMEIRVGVPAYGLQGLPNKCRNPKRKSNPNTMCLPSTLGEDQGSGHFYLAKNRTFLLCVDRLPKRLRRQPVLRCLRLRIVPAETQSITVNSAPRQASQEELADQRPGRVSVRAVGKKNDRNYFWPALEKSFSVPTTWPCKVPGMSESRSTSPDLASAMVTRLTSSVRPRARS